MIVGYYYQICYFMDSKTTKKNDKEKRFKSYSLSKGKNKLTLPCVPFSVAISTQPKTDSNNQISLF